MKYALFALLGSLVSTVTVVLSGHTPALLVGLGFVTAILLYTRVLRLIGINRYSRWFYAGAGQPVKQGTGHLGKLFGGVSRTSASSGQRQFSNRTGKSETIRRGALRFSRRTCPVGNASERERGKLASNPRQLRRAPTYNNSVLRPVHQDVLSALMNLGCSFRQAEEAVQCVTDGPGESFDQLFRKALDTVNSGKMLTRKAVA